MNTNSINENNNYINVLFFSNNYILLKKKNILIKFLYFAFIFFILRLYSINIEKFILLLKQRNKDNTNKFNLKFDKNIKKKINIGIYAFCIKNGGRARMTSLLINNLEQLKIFNIVLLTKRDKEKDEYKLPNDLKRIIIKNDLIKQIKRNKIEILIYQLSNHVEMEILNKLNKVKIIFYQHLGILDWIYGNYSIFKTIYRDYIKSKYVINIIPYENDYLFKKWKINSILMDNFITYEFDKVISSNLITKKILMIGRGDAKKKRFEVGIQSMEYINQVIPECEMLIISDLIRITRHESLVNNINLKNKIKFVGYTASPEIYYKNSSVNIFPSISEAFPLVICETKIYGIPNILLGLDYTSVFIGGTLIVYDETSESLAQIAIKLLQNQTFKNIMGKKARKSMKKFNNNLLLIKWIKLISSVYNGGNHYKKLIKKEKLLSNKESINILNSQIQLLKMRISFFKNITINIIENFDLMLKYNI